MLFKCKCLHIGQANAKTNYLINNTVLLSTEMEKDVGVVVSSDMKVSEQCGIAARKGNQILGLIRRNIAYRDKRLIIPLYISLVRPHLEYCIQAWRPHMRKDIATASMAEWLRAWDTLAMMKLWRREVVSSIPDRGTIVG